MKNNVTEDLKDVREIKTQKSLEKRSREEMATWTLGKGLKNKKGK